MKAVINFDNGALDSAIGQRFVFMVQNGFFAMKGKTGYVYVNKAQGNAYVYDGSKYTKPWGDVDLSTVDKYSIGYVPRMPAGQEPWFYYGRITRAEEMANGGATLTFVQSTYKGGNRDDFNYTIPSFRNKEGWIWLDADAYAAYKNASSWIDVEIIGFNAADIPAAVRNELNSKNDSLQPNDSDRNQSGSDGLHSDTQIDPPKPDGGGGGGDKKSKSSSMAAPAALGVAGVGAVGYALMSGGSPMHGRRGRRLRGRGGRKLSGLGGGAKIALLVVGAGLIGTSVYLVVKNSKPKTTGEP